MARPSTYERLIGTRKGKLLVTGLVRDPRGKPRLICKCDCGKECQRLPWNLTDAGSCGCDRVRFIQNQISTATPEPEYTRLKAQVILQNVKPNERGCLEWQGYRHPIKGYGHIGMKSKRHEHTHRVVYRGVRGPIPDGWDVCHTCDNPPCCNPLHLFAAPRVANLIDMRNKGRNRQTQKTHCPKGHEYAIHAVRHPTRATWRACGICVKERQKTPAYVEWRRAYQRRKREEKRQAAFSSGKTANADKT